MSFGRRTFLRAVIACAPLAHRAAAQTAAERLVAAMQDGNKVIYLRHPLPDDGARELGNALRALRVPLNEILASPRGSARQTAELAFGADRLRVDANLAVEAPAGDRVHELQELLRTIPGPGMNRLIVGDRTPLELAAERQFPDVLLPEGGMAVFLPAPAPQLLGTITADRVIESARARGAM